LELLAQLGLQVQPEVLLQEKPLAVQEQALPQVL
jgi:hypothetical protein